MKLKAFFQKHGSSVLTALAVVGTISAVVSAVKAKPKYDKLVEEKRKEKENDEPLTKKEVVTCAAKAYAVTAGITAVAVGCAIGAKAAGAKEVARTAAEGTAMLAASKKMHDEYKEVVEGKLKPKQLDEVRDELAKRRTEDLFTNMTQMEADDLTEEVEGPVPGRQYLADAWSGTVWVDDPVKVERRFNDFNVLYLGHDHDYVPAYEYYDHMKIKVGRTQSIQHGGWAYDVKSISFDWITYPITTGPLKGKIVWAMQFKDGDEPLDINK